MAPACIRVHNALCSQLPIESDADVALQGHYINYKYVPTFLCRNIRLLRSMADNVWMPAWEAQNRQYY